MRSQLLQAVPPRKESVVFDLRRVALTVSASLNVKESPALDQRGLGYSIWLHAWQLVAFLTGQWPGGCAAGWKRQSERPGQL
eukprot:283547-Amphidinium_carterae.1